MEHKIQFQVEPTKFEPRLKLETRPKFFKFGFWSLVVIKGSKIQRFKGSKVQRIKGSKDQRIKGSKVQRFKGSKVQRFKGSKDQRIKGSKVKRFKGSKDQRIIGCAGGKSDLNHFGVSLTHSAHSKIPDSWFWTTCWLLFKPGTSCCCCWS